MAMHQLERNGALVGVSVPAIVIGRVYGLLRTMSYFLGQEASGVDLRQQMGRTRPYLEYEWWCRSLTLPFRTHRCFSLQCYSQIPTLLRQREMFSVPPSVGPLVLS
jgi:hypothetical protein